MASPPIPQTAASPSSRKRGRSESPEAVPPTQLLRILFVDTHVAQAQDMRRILEHEVMNYLLPEYIPTFDVLRDGAMAVSQAQLVKYDVIFLSDSLLGMTAFQVAAALLQLHMRNVHLVLISLPDNGLDERQVEAEGFDAILHRPLSSPTIAGVIRALRLNKEEKEQLRRKQQIQRQQLKERLAEEEARLPPWEDLPMEEEENEEKDDVGEGHEEAQRQEMNSATSGAGAVAAASSWLAAMANGNKSKDKENKKKWEPPRILSMPISDAFTHLKRQGAAGGGHAAGAGGSSDTIQQQQNQKSLPQQHQRPRFGWATFRRRNTSSSPSTSSSSSSSPPAAAAAAQATEPSNTGVNDAGQCHENS